MRAVSFMYHDVLECVEGAGSGVSGMRGNRYTIRRPDFEAHMAVLRLHLPEGPALVTDVRQAQPGTPLVMLTVDDGGLSAYTTIMEVLDRLQWKAHFFIVTDWIGKQRCMKPAHLRALRAGGHLIGSHSSTHPSMMSSHSRRALAREWGDSVNRLADILGAEVHTASLPGGYYSRDVAEAASRCGIRVLFTSEPTDVSHMVESCTVFGRYVITRGTSPERLAALLQGKSWPRMREYVAWALKKSARLVGGKTYLKLRTLALERPPV